MSCIGLRASRFLRKGNVKDCEHKAHADPCCYGKDYKGTTWSQEWASNILENTDLLPSDSRSHL
jgi:hypothetical protein